VPRGVAQFVGADAPEFEECDGDSDEEYEPREILNQRTQKGEVQYFVWWLGYQISESTWEVYENIASAETVIEAWVAKLKSRHDKREQAKQAAAKARNPKQGSCNIGKQLPHLRAKGKRNVTKPKNHDV
jgi:hypothetical protein